MKGKSIILPGGSGGLGSAVTELVASRGAVPVIGCRHDQARAEALAGEIRSRHGIAAPVVVGDLIEADTRVRLLDAAESAGPLYGLVPLVGAPSRIPIEEATPEDFLQSSRANFVAPMLIARDFAARVKGSDASIVLVATMQAVGVFPGSTLYAAPKAALIHAGRILARQWGGLDRIRVNVVAPGVTTSGMARTSIAGGKYDPFIQDGVITRFGTSQDVARAIALFLEPDNYLTGQLLTVDGGLTIRR